MYQFNRLVSTADRSPGTMTASTYEKLTFPSLRSQLQSIDSQPGLIAIGADLDGQPVGLAIAQIDPNTHSAEILSLFVVPNHRRCGVGTELLAILTIQLQQRKCQTIKIIHISRDETSSLSQFLCQAGWSQPELRMIVCEEMIIKMKGVEWLNLHQKMPPGYTIFPWSELQERERQELQAADWYPIELSPFQEEEIIEPINSLGLRYEDRIVGWTICHRIAPQTIRYTAMFVRKELQSIGRSLGCLGQSIQLQLIDGTVERFIFTVLADNTKMITFAKRRIAPHLNSTEFIRHSWGQIKQIPSDF